MTSERLRGGLRCGCKDKGVRLQDQRQGVQLGGVRRALGARGLLRVGTVGGRREASHRGELAGAQAGCVVARRRDPPTPHLDGARVALRAAAVALAEPVGGPRRRSET